MLWILVVWPLGSTLLLLLLMLLLLFRHYDTINKWCRLFIFIATLTPVVVVVVVVAPVSSDALSSIRGANVRSFFAHASFGCVVQLFRSSANSSNGSSSSSSSRKNVERKSEGEEKN